MTDQAMKIVNGERKYFAIIPHLVDDMGLSVWAYRLYGHFRRVAGEDGGACWQSTRTLADACKMSTGQVAKAKQELVEAGLITITSERGAHGDYHVITITDVWALNMARYSQTEQTETGERSPHERYRSHHERKRSPHETKKNPGRIPTHKREKKKSLRENSPVPTERGVSDYDFSSPRSLPCYAGVNLTVKASGGDIEQEIPDEQERAKFWRYMVKAWEWCVKNNKERYFWNALEHYTIADRRNMTLSRIAGAMPNAVITWNFPNDLENGGAGYETDEYVEGIANRVLSEMNHEIEVYG